MQVVLKEESQVVATPLTARGENFWALFCLILLMIVCFAIPGIGGEFSCNDDAIYANAVKSIVETGVFSIAGGNAFDFLPINIAAVWCKLTGFSYAHLRTLTIGFHVLGTVGIYLAIRQLRVKSLDAALLSAVYAFNPFLVNLSLTFMTDVPALSIVNWAFYALLVGLNKKQIGPFLIAVILLTSAMSVRQTSIFLLPVIVFCAWRGLSKFQDKLLILTSVAIPVLAYACLQIWLWNGVQVGIGYSNYSSLLFSSLSILMAPTKCLEQFAFGACYLGLFLAPMTVPLLILAVQPNYRFRWVLAFTLSVLVTVVPLSWLQSHGAYMPYSLNLFYPPILGTYCLIGGVPLWSTEHLKQFTYFSDFLAFSLVFCITVPMFSYSPKLNSSDKDSMLFSISTLMCLVPSLLVLLTASNFDRYYLLGLSPLILCLVPLWCANASFKVRITSFVLVSGMAIYSVLASLDVMNFMRCQSESVKYLNSVGVKDERIDGGPAHCLPLGGDRFSYTFKQGVGWPERMRGSAETRKFRWWPILGEDYIVSTIGVAGYHKVKTTEYWSPLSWKKRHMFILESDLLTSGESN